MTSLRRQILFPVIASALSASLAFDTLAQNASFDPANTYIDAKQYDKAIEFLNGLDVSSENEAQKYILLAKIYLLTGAGIAAETAVERARRLGADYAVTAVAYAKSLLIQGKYSAARAALQGVTVPDEYLLDAYIISGDANFAEGMLAEARRDYGLAREKNDTDFQAYLGLARLELREGELLKAEELSSAAEERAADNTMVQYTQGLIAKYLGDTEKAEKYFTESVRLLDGNIMANLELASIRINQGNIDAAEKFLDTVYAISPRQPMALYLSGVIKASRGEYEEASTLLNRAQSITDVYLPAIYVKGMVAYQLGKHAIAIESLNKVLEVRPDNKTVRLALATSYSKSERPATALKVLEPLLNAESVDVNVLTVAGAAAIASGDAEKGESYYSKAEELNKTGAVGGIEGLSTKLALAQYAVGDTEQALSTMSTIVAGSEVELRELGLMGSMQIKTKDYEAAKVTIDRILSMAPKRALGYNMKGTLAYKLGDFPEAVVSYSAALDRSDEYHTARRNRGLAYMRLGNYKKASGDLKKLLQSKPDDVLAKAALAKTLLLMGEPVEAVEFFKEAVRVLPRSIKLATDYAQALTEAGNTTLAISQARKAAVMGENKPQVLKRMGLLLLRLQQPAAAERPLSRHAAFNPNSGQAHLLHGRAMLQMGLFTGSIMSFQRAAMAANDAPDENILEWYFFTAEALGNKYDKALKRLDLLRPDKRPVDIKAGVVGDFLLAIGDVVAAETAYRTALQSDFASDVIIGLARALAEQNRGDDAIAELESYLKKSPEDRLVLVALGQRYEELKQYENASTQYEKILRIGIADAHVAARLANMYLNLGNSRSIKLASSAHLMMPDDPFIQDIYGWVMLQAGRNTEEAIPALEKAVRRAPAKALYKYHLGMAYLARGQKLDAERVLQQALSLDDSFEGAAEAKRQLTLLEY